MGMFDYIEHEIKCPNCHSKMAIREQIKWTNKCRCHTYKVGDMIDAPDGEYTQATYVRPFLQITCDLCDEHLFYKVIVKNGVLSKISLLSGDELIREKDNYQKWLQKMREMTEEILNSED